MKQYEQLDKLIADHDGIIQTSQVVAERIFKPVFYNYIKEKKMEQVAHGVYASTDAWTKYGIGNIK
ncbi:MAG: type IV toxin-antitoxin system AbiEi family antitoxin domain-containing protein [Acetobacterium sp.]